MRKIIFAVMVVMLPSICFAEIQDKKLAQKCLDDIKDRLKDPYTAKIVSFEKVNGKKYEYLLKYRAKNSYGAYDFGEHGCDGGGAYPWYDIVKEIEYKEKKIKEYEERKRR